MHFMHSLLLKKEKDEANTVYLKQARAGTLQEMTWSQVMLAARKVANFLRSINLRKGAHIGIISKNCAEWFITDFGITLANMVSVPLFANQHEESIHYVLDHADVQVVFIGKLDDHETVRSYIPEKYPTIGFDYHTDLEYTHQWQEVMACDPLTDVVQPQPDDLYTIIYSSGTTGFPKGAMYTHEAIAQYLSLIPQDLKRIRDLDFYKLVSYLPLAHVYERSAIELSSIAIQADVGFIESMDKFLQNIQVIEPNLFTAVPRIWTVFQQKIDQKVPLRKLNFLLKIPIISSLLKNKIKNSLGFSSCTNYFSGASFMPEPIMEYFDKLGIVIQDGYGQTENLAYATVSLLSDRKPGYVGKARLGVKVKLGEDKELLVHSPCLMSGYYKDSLATRGAFNDEGWLRTGDIAEIDTTGQVKILGRISENFKNQTGEFVAPTPIEERFADNKLIDQLCLVGSGLPRNVLLVTLNDSACIGKSRNEITALLLKNLHDVNEQLVKFEKIANIIVVNTPWTINNELLTPTLKVKRKEVAKHYHDLIEKALGDHSAVIWE